MHDPPLRDGQHTVRRQFADLYRRLWRAPNHPPIEGGCAMKDAWRRRPPGEERRRIPMNAWRFAVFVVAVAVYITASEMPR
ncbi:hypothetical protein ACFYZ4_11575 [Streptomyces sp. NPDC001513]|uniref:hypothetical protein n=1 Tax=Streptomyces sp. NPDC001513 TaxID=3364580 RepID=UPI0036BC75AB